MKLIGVTGSFCSGKTTVSNIFKGLGAGIIDADKIVHQLYKKDKGTKASILSNFGREILSYGKIDRKKLGEVAFSNRRTLSKLCKIVHPKVIKIIKDEIKRINRSIIIIDAPLLIEAELHKIVDYVVVVKASFKKCIERAKQKGLTTKDILVRRKLQIPLGEKVKYADFVIDNSQSKQYTKKVVMNIWLKLMTNDK